MFKNSKINHFVLCILVVALIVQSSLSLVAVATELASDDIYI